MDRAASITRQLVAFGRKHMLFHLSKPFDLRVLVEQVGEALEGS